LPLWKWFFATYLLCESRKGMSANQISRMLKITYKTSWYLCHRIRHTMTQIAKPNLDGTVEVDETSVGGKKIDWRAYLAHRTLNTKILPAKFRMQPEAPF
jgi:hypothetical protein